MNMTPNPHAVTARNLHFVPCAPRLGMVKPLMVQANCAMSGSIMLISPAVFRPEKPQAGLHRFNGALVQLRQCNLKRSEICRGKISRPKIKTTSKKGR
jgi:hypothetical protein